MRRYEAHIMTNLFLVSLWFALLSPITRRLHVWLAWPKIACFAAAFFLAPLLLWLFIYLILLLLVRLRILPREALFGGSEYSAKRPANEDDPTI